MIVQDDDADAMSVESEDFQTSRTAMESALAGPSAAHPVEGYGSGNLSLAKVLRLLFCLILDVLGCCVRCASMILCLLYVHSTKVMPL